MASKYGYTVGIGMDTSGLQVGLKTIDGNLRDFAAELKDTEKALKALEQSGQDSSEMMANKQEILNKIYQQTQEKLWELASIHDKVYEAYDNDAIDGKAFSEYNKVLAETFASSKRLEEQIEELNAEMNGETTPESVQHLAELEESYKGIESELEEVNSTMREAGETEALTAQQETLLQEAIDNTTERLELLKQAQEAAAQALANGDISAEEYRSLERQVESTEAQLNSYAKQLDEV